jgi:hypothetical protein
MAEKNIIKLMNRQTLTALAICTAGLVLFVLIGIIPLRKASLKAEADIRAAKAELERQKILHPVYIELEKKKNQLPRLALPFPDPQPVKREEVKLLQEELRDIAIQNGMEPVSIVPDISTMRRNSERMLIVVDLKGDWMSLRDFLVQLGNMPGFDFLGKVTVKSEEEGKRFTLQIWAALESGKKGDKKGKG